MRVHSLAMSPLSDGPLSTAERSDRIHWEGVDDVKDGVEAPAPTYASIFSGIDVGAAATWFRPWGFSHIGVQN